MGIPITTAPAISALGVPMVNTLGIYEKSQFGSIGKQSFLKGSCLGVLGTVFRMVVTSKLSLISWTQVENSLYFKNELF